MKRAIGLALALCACGSKPLTGVVEPGTCSSPARVAVPFSAPGEATTSGKMDVTRLSCAPVTQLAEAVYVVEADGPKQVLVHANDESGQGIGIAVAQDTCDGTGVCTWASNGIINQTFSLTKGTWYFVIERNPTGRFSFSAE